MAALSSCAQALIQAGVLDKSAAETLQAEAAKAGVPFIAYCAAQKKINTEAAALALASVTNTPYFDLGALNLSILKPTLVDKKVIAEHHFLPLWTRGRILVIAVADPTDLGTISKIKFATSMLVEVLVVTADKLRIALDKFLSGAESSMSSLIGDSKFDLEVSSDEAATDTAADAEDASDSPVVMFVNKMLMDAIQRGASDIHFEPYEKFYRVRFRVDGVLQEVAKPPKSLSEKMAARIKVMSRLDTSERRLPQDGRTQIKITKDKAIDFRVSVLPTLHGEKIVMRILDPSASQVPIEQLGYEPDQKAALLAAVTRPYGMVLVTGPTGSGKTVSLYTCLNVMNVPGTNISTAEDPAEINLPGVNQVNVNERVGLTFTAALKSFLRQDPDVIMVGEIRDIETAEIAIKAAQTGHMVLSTLHTNDAPTTITRLVNMGIAPFNIATSVIMVTAQRLARRLCTCKQPVSFEKGVLLSAGYTDEDLSTEFQMYGPKPDGCERCGGSGYKGRVGIYQVMPITEAMNAIIIRGGNAIEIAAQAKLEKVRDLRQSGLLKVKQGLTSLAEVEAVTNL